ncbi:helix-turn-helix domain-containing protein [Streptococcus sp. sy004]|uniref:helix-turn-helix domain-containing protein n=1 Tax=Streptococcus sp. sy004 TaxID=2600149 RepID=UPI0011B6FE18|nr:helix-turn-helix domain-containing protein [Streptococcus sp. sy004]TWT09786.1 helix-turn-helix domain-containing protein [Streptococcus sp. sy004]
MQIVDLMEKADAGSYRMLCHLRNCAAPLTLKELSQAVSLSKSTIRKYIDSFHEQVLLDTLAIHITLKEDYCQLELPVNLEWSELLNSFLTRSIKYQIINYLLEQNSFSIQELCQTLSISEATLHRHLAGLNELLAEFNLNISNGHWQGSEHQIRYFYWLLYSQTWSLSKQQIISSSVTIQREVQLIERLCQSSLTAEAKQDLSLWFYISHKRWPGGKKDSRVLTNLLIPYQQNIFFQRLEKACLRYFSRYAVELDQVEAYSLFAFLVSKGILPRHNMNFLLGFGGPVVDQLTKLIHCLRKEEICGWPLPDVVNDVLSQLLHQAYFFKGSLWLFTQEYDVNQSYFISLIKPSHLQLAQEFFPDDEGQREEVLCYRWHFLALLAYLTKPVQKVYRLGLALTGDSLMLDLVKLVLKEELASFPYLDVLSYEKDQVYDGLVVSSTFCESVPYPIYRLPATFQSADREKIAYWLQEEVTKKRSL